MYADYVRKKENHLRQKENSLKQTRLYAQTTVQRQIMYEYLCIRRWLHKRAFQKCWMSTNVLLRIFMKISELGKVNLYTFWLYYWLGYFFCPKIFPHFQKLSFHKKNLKKHLLGFCVTKLTHITSWATLCRQKHWKKKWYVYANFFHRTELFVHLLLV